MILHLIKKETKIGKGTIFGNIMILKSGPEDRNQKFLCKSTLDTRRNAFGNDFERSYFAVILASRGCLLSCYI